MFDYTNEIRNFIKLNFEPTYPDLANVKYTTDEFLAFLFLVFPVDCISDYELNDILLSLDYERHIYNIEHLSIKKGKYDDDEDEISKSYILVSGWCMFTNKIPKE